MLRSFLSHIKPHTFINHTRCYATKQNDSPPNNNEFQAVYSFPYVKYFGLLNRLKVYQLIGTSVVVPGCGILEILNVVPSGAFLAAAYIGITGAAVMSVATIPFKNIIGFIYLDKDNKTIKLSYLDYWGRRKDQFVAVDNWIPLLDLPSKKMDPLYLTPQLIDGTRYKLFIKYGHVLNSKRMGEVLE